MFDPLEKVLKTFFQGDFVIIFDEDREEEADLFVLAEHIDTEKVNFLLHHARGMICTACVPEIFERLQIPLMVELNENPHGTNFGVLVDAAQNISTGVSAEDRAETIKILASPDSKYTDLVRPGHTAPLIARDPKVRFGHTEAAVEMAHKVGKFPVVAICEILNQKGSKATIKEAKELSALYNIPMTNLETVKKYILESALVAKATPNI